MPGNVEGNVRSISPSGNLVTDIPVTALAAAPRDESVRVDCDGHETLGLFDSPDGQPEMTFIAVLGGGGSLELTIVGDNAAAMLGIRPGAAVRVTW